MEKGSGIKEEAMYVAVSVVDHRLGKVQLNPTFEGVVEEAIQIANYWPPIVSNFDINDVREQLTNIYEYHCCNSDTGFLYSIYIGVVDES